jgi:hypothetical protein
VTEVIRKPQWAIDRIGLSTDVKGTDAVQGTTFYEQDTGDTYVFLLGTWSLKYSQVTPVHNMVYDASIMDWVAQPLINTSTVMVSGPVAVTGTFFQATQPVSGPLTNTELRAATVNTQDANFEIFLRQLLAGIFSPAWLNMAINSLQVSQPTAANLLCTATVGTVGGLTNIGGLSADQVTYNDSAIQWATCVRNYLT